MRTQGLRLLAGTFMLVAALSCKPLTEEGKYRKTLRWTQVEDVRTHLEGGKDANHRFEDGAMPVHVVAKALAGEPSIMRLLIEKGADVNAKDGDGKTAWDLVLKDGKRTLSEDSAGLLLALLDGGFQPPTPVLEDGRGLLHTVAHRAPSVRLVSVLVKKYGHDVDARDKNGWTPLHVAAFENNAEAATGLLENGADVNAETTKTIQRVRDRAGTEIVDWRYEAGSRPLNLTRSQSRGRFDKDVRKVLEQHGATPGRVKNRSR
ncbi:MAG: ankyrin repeat domain-containing protein [Nannocystaceae bacterium]|nr:ankyrin repeat domain-containing protein [Nannocystaceae bacterium]